MGLPPIINPLRVAPTDATCTSLEVLYGEHTPEGAKVYGAAVFPFEAIASNDAPIHAERARIQTVMDRIAELNNAFTPMITTPSGPVGLKLVSH